MQPTKKSGGLLDNYTIPQESSYAMYSQQSSAPESSAPAIPSEYPHIQKVLLTSAPVTSPPISPEAYVALTYPDSEGKTQSLNTIGDLPASPRINKSPTSRIGRCIRKIIDACDRIGKLAKAILTGLVAGALGYGSWCAINLSVALLIHAGLLLSIAPAFAGALMAYCAVKCARASLLNLSQALHPKQ